MAHAVRYAEEATKVFLYEKFKVTFPDIFNHATIQTRPASSKDYYIPPSIADQCIVVTRTSFDETACTLLGCFPFKQELKRCEKTDSVRWVPLSQNHILACQPACEDEEHAIDTTWKEGKCVQANPLKKMFALLPEQIFGQTSKHPLHNGLDWDAGTLRLNRAYCEAYGLNFSAGDCTMDSGQSIAEFLLGMTVYRKMKQNNLKAPVPSQPPPLPTVFQSRKRQKRSATQRETDTSDESNEETSRLASQISTELAADFGIDVSLSALKRLLVKKAPKLLVKATSSVVIKSALIHAIVRSYTSLAIKSLMLMGKMAGGASNAFFIYGVATMILDIMDPYNYDKVLDAKTLEKINRQMDIRFFGRETNFEIQVTPEFLWDHVYAHSDESERIEYMAERISEYIEAIRLEPTKKVLPPMKLKQDSREKSNHWENWLHAVIVLTLASIAMLTWQWIQVWAVLLFFTLVWWA